MPRRTLNAQAVRSALLPWYRARRRDLPWRRRRDAYGIWVSEVMLQQTRVDTVIPYYERFLQRWPTARSLAEADPEAVRAAWSGLGYYRRAKLMLEAAGAIARDHGGELPTTAEALLTLPGFGRYTAGAVASIAHGERVPAVDGNVSRVLARLLYVEGDVTRGEPARRILEAATTLAEAGSRDDAGDWTQAVMELGATICTPKRARCELCPLSQECVALARRAVDRVPPPKKRPARPIVALSAKVLTDARGRIWLEQRPPTGLFAELWTPPLVEGPLPDAAGLERAGDVVHVLTHRELRIEVYRGQLTRSKALTAFEASALDELGLPAVSWKILRAALPQLPKRPRR